MKNIFKLVSVFMAIALVTGVLLFSGVIASADEVVATWSGNTNYIWAPSGNAQVYGWDTNQPGETWLSFAGKLGDLDADSYVKITASADFAETPATAGFKCRTWSISTAIPADSISATSVEYTIEGPLTYNDGDPNLEFVLTTAALTGFTDTDVDVTVTVYKKGGSTEPEETGDEPEETGAEPEETGAESSVTEAQPTATATATEAQPSETEPSETEPSATEPSATETAPTEPVTLVETVLVENNVGGAKVLKPEKTDAWFLQVDEIKADIAANGPIDPDKGEYYQIVVTGYVDNGEADFHLGEGLNWEEYWGESTIVTTEEGTAVATIPVAIPAEGIGALYLADSGEAGHTLTWSYAKVSVFRVGEPTEPTQESTETEPSVTETNPTAVVYGDANGDGAVNMKDVLLVRKYIAGIEVELDMTASDVNVDGAVNMKDVLQLRKFLAGLITELGV